MALAISVGFVVDDAIVMIENCFRNLEKGMAPAKAALEGARQIGFTVISISISLVAAFIPLLHFVTLAGASLCATCFVFEKWKGLGLSCSAFT